MFCNPVLRYIIIIIKRKVVVTCVLRPQTGYCYLPGKNDSDGGGI